MLKDLRQVGVFVTESCNLACSYCFAANMENRVADFPVAKAAVDLLFRDCVQSRDVSVAFWGGEPLLAFDLIESLVLHGERRAAQTGKSIRFAIPTNATLLSERSVDFCLDHNVSLSLSLDGTPLAQGLRPTRGGGSSVPKVTAALDLLDRRWHGKLPGVRMTVSPLTAGSLHENVSFFFERGFTHVYFSPVHQATWSAEALDAYQQSMFRLADDWLRRISSGSRLYVTNWDKILSRLALQRNGHLKAAGRRIECGAGSTMIAVDIHGEIYPCHRFAFYDKAHRIRGLGNVFSSVIDTAALTVFNSSVIDCGTLEKRCASCEHSDVCMGFCPALNDALTGELHLIDERQCQLGLIEQRVVGYLEETGGTLPAFVSHVQSIARATLNSGAVSAELATFFTSLGDEGRQELTDRAAEILAEIETRRQCRGRET